MFSYSIDELIAQKQKDSAEELLSVLGEKCKLQISPEIDTAFTEFNIDLPYLRGIASFVKECKESIVFVGVARDNYPGHRALSDMKKGYDELKKPWTDVIPYIECYFTKPVASYPVLQNSFFFFFTKYHDYEGARDCVLHYFNKFNKLKAFA